MSDWKDMWEGHSNVEREKQRMTAYRDYSIAVINGLLSPDERDRSPRQVIKAVDNFVFALIEREEQYWQELRKKSKGGDNE